MEIYIKKGDLKYGWFVDLNEVSLIEIFLNIEYQYEQEEEIPKNWNEVNRLSRKPIKKILDNYEKIQNE